MEFDKIVSAPLPNDKILGTGAFDHRNDNEKAFDLGNESGGASSKGSKNIKGIGSSRTNKRSATSVELTAVNTPVEGYDFDDDIEIEPSRSKRVKSTNKTNTVTRANKRASAASFNNGFDAIPELEEFEAISISPKNADIQTYSRASTRTKKRAVTTVERDEVRPRREKILASGKIAATGTNKRAITTVNREKDNNNANGNDFNDIEIEDVQSTREKSLNTNENVVIQTYTRPGRRTSKRALTYHDYNVDNYFGFLDDLEKEERQQHSRNPINILLESKLGKMNAIRRIKKVNEEDSLYVFQTMENNANDQGSPNKKRKIASPTKGGSSPTVNIFKQTEKAQTDIRHILDGSRIRVISCEVVKEAIIREPSPVIFKDLDSVSQQ